MIYLSLTLVVTFSRTSHNKMARLDTDDVSEWLKDDHINTYTTRIHKLLTQHNEALAEKIHVSDTFFALQAKLMYDRGKQAYTKWMQKLCKKFAKNHPLEDKEKWIIPLNVENSHWVLLVFILKRRVMLVYNSQSSISYQKEIMVYLKIIARFLQTYAVIHDVEHLSTVTSTREKRWCIVDKDLFREEQSDGSSCGVYLLVAAHLNMIIDTDRMASGVQIYSIKQVREFIRELIMVDSDLRRTTTTTRGRIKECLECICNMVRYEAFSSDDIHRQEGEP